MALSGTVTVLWLRAVDLHGRRGTIVQLSNVAQSRSAYTYSPTNTRYKLHNIGVDLLKPAAYTYMAAHVPSFVAIGADG